LIDDEPATRLVTQNRLKDLGFQVVAVESGAMGLHEAREAAFDLIVEDVGLGAGGGGVNAFEVCKRLKQTPQTAGVPVVMTSKQTSGVEEMRRGFEAGCDAFLPKAHQAVLDEVVRAALRGRAQLADLARQIRGLEESQRRLQGGTQQGADLEQALKGDPSLVQRELAAGRPDGLLLVDGEGIVRFFDRGARDLLGGGLVGKNLGRLAPASGLEAFVRDARTDSREGFRFDVPERNGRTARSLTASVVPLVTEHGGRDPDMRVVLILDGSRHKVATELMRMKEYTIPRREVGVLLEAARASFSPSTLIGTSPEMQIVRAQVIEAARSRQPVLIVGPTDGGKQHAARAIHFEGDAGGPFVPINCAALASANLETELFGLVKGATEEAVADRPGVIHLASHGTVYLENVDALTPELQERLEETMRTGKVRRTGAKRQERIEVRVVASSERDLRRMAQEGALRPSLLELLISLEIHVPGLCDREIDVLPLARHFIGRFGGGRPLELSQDAARQLTNHGWPGNVRELASCIERACHNTAGEVIDIDHLPAPLGDSQSSLATHEIVPRAPARVPEVGGTHTPLSGHAPDGPGGGQWEIGPEEPVSLELYEKKALLRALHETGGDKLAAARLLKVGKSTLYRKLKRYGIQ
jgi:DNA-binding NtrC family response regulator